MVKGNKQIRSIITMGAVISFIMPMLSVLAKMPNSTITVQESSIKTAQILFFAGLIAYPYPIRELSKFGEVLRRRFILAIRVIVAMSVFSATVLAMIWSVGHFYGDKAPEFAGVTYEAFTGMWTSILVIAIMLTAYILAPWWFKIEDGDDKANKG